MRRSFRFKTKVLHLCCMSIWQGIELVGSQIFGYRLPCYMNLCHHTDPRSTCTSTIHMRVQSQNYITAESTPSAGIPFRIGRLLNSNPAPGSGNTISWMLIFLGLVLPSLNFISKLKRSAAAVILISVKASCLPGQANFP